MSETSQPGPDVGGPDEKNLGEQGENRESEDRFFDDVVFTEQLAGRSGGKVYRSSAPDRELIVLREGLITPEAGKPYRVRLMEDTKPEDSTTGKFVVELVLDDAEKKNVIIKLASEAVGLLDQNDLIGIEGRLKLVYEMLSEDDRSHQNLGGPVLFDKVSEEQKAGMPRDHIQTLIQLSVCHSLCQNVFESSLPGTANRDIGNLKTSIEEKFSELLETTGSDQDIYQDWRKKTVRIGKETTPIFDTSKKELKWG